MSKSETKFRALKMPDFKNANSGIKKSDSGSKSATKVQEFKFQTQTRSKEDNFRA